MAHGGRRKGAGRKPGSGKYGEATTPVRLPVSMVDNVMRFVAHQGYQLPLYESKVQAGFPSPADDFVERTLDLNEHLVERPSSTFLVRAKGDSMQGVGIFSGDLLVVDKSLLPQHGDIVIAALDGELTVKRLHKNQAHCLLLAENPDYPAIEIKDGQSLHIWGVVLHAVRMLRH